MHLNKTWGILGRLRERGATLVETALVIPFLLILVFGAVESGVAFIDWMAMTNATREGARVGALAGPASDADEAILRVVAQASCAMHSGDLVSVRIYQVNGDGDQLGGQNNYNAAAIDCDLGTSSFTLVGAAGWPVGSRGNTIGNLDRLAVEATFQRENIFGFVPIFEGTWRESAVFRIDPETEG